MPPSRKSGITYVKIKDIADKGVKFLNPWESGKEGNTAKAADKLSFKDKDGKVIIFKNPGDVITWYAYNLRGTSLRLDSTSGNYTIEVFSFTP